MRAMVLLLLAVRLPVGWLRRQPAAVRRILVLHHLLLGDALMVTPLLAKLRERYPEAELRLALPQAFVALYYHRPYGVVPIGFDPREPATLISLLREPRQDLVLLPADNRYSWLARAVGGRWIVAFAGDRPAYKNWFVDELRSYSAEPTAWGDTCAELVDGPRPQTYRPESWPAPPYRPFLRPSGEYAVLQLGVSSRLKHWLPDRWRDLAAWLDARGIAPVWSAGPGEEDVILQVDPEGRYLSLAGKLDLAQLWQLLAGARLLVCPDSGVAHLGRVVGAPTVTLFGPGSALVCGAGDFWHDSPYAAVTMTDFPCRDQNIQFFRVIPWMRRCERLPPDCVDPKCMQAISSESVRLAVAKMLAQTASKAKS